jgi:hypothetical protein
MSDERQPRGDLRCFGFVASFFELLLRCNAQVDISTSLPSALEGVAFARWQSAGATLAPKNQ